MPTLTRSIRQQQRDLAASLRSQQKTWAEVAAAFCNEYGVNVRAALRMARGWSQREAADRWNVRWPDDPKTFKNFSYWEQWPAATGHAPSLDVLARLAELYECSLADLVADCADFRHSDEAFRDGQGLAEIQRALDPASTDADLADLISRLQEVEVHELARATAAWSERLGHPTSRRALLLKLSAGLSLAAASPAIADDAAAAVQTRPASNAESFEGVWHSRYLYPSTGRNDVLVGEHYLAARKHGKQMVCQSLPHSTGSRLRLELTVEPPIATGTWRETTSVAGYYKGATYHGTLQLVIDPGGRRMRGMWLGFGKDFTVNSGEWELDWQDGSTSPSTLRRFHDLA